MGPQQDQGHVPPSPSLSGAAAGLGSRSPRPSSSQVNRSVSFDDEGIHRTESRQRRPSTGERINELLEVGRLRAAAMGNTNSRAAAPVSENDGPDSEARNLNDSRQDVYSSADEHTGIIMRGPDRNYQTMNPLGPDEDGAGAKGAGPRARRSTGSRRSAASSRTELPPPAEDADGEEDRRDPAGGAARRRDRRKRAKKAWHQGVLSHFASIELENKGSVARDHLALERTFLAWLRTSLAFASIGIAVTQLFRLNTSLSDGGDHSGEATLRRLGKPLGATFLGISIVILFLGYQRYFNAQRWIIAGKFPASRGTIIAVAFVAFAVMMASLVVVIVVHPRTREV